MNSKLNREELAALEVGHTTVSRLLAKSIVFCFLLCIVTVPLVQVVVNRASPDQPSLLASLQELFRDNRTKAKGNESPFATIKHRNNQLLERMDTFEKQLEEESFLRSYLLAPGQQVLLSLGYGNEKVYPGNDSWLFYRPDMDYLIGPGFLGQHQLDLRREGGRVWETSVQPDPVQTIIEFHSQLASRGIQLILMPTPIKASLHPEFFSSGSYDVPLQNRSWNDFLAQIEEAGIHLFDPAAVLQSYQKEHGVPVYLKTDTHWRPEAMEAVAEKLAAFIHSNVSLSSNASEFVRQDKSLSNRGDIDVMLRMPELLERYSKEEVLLHPVVTRTDELWQATIDAEVLLLGDSFSNIFSLSGMGWGEGAGFGEQLSYMLQRPVDLILQNDAGAFATREMLAKELSRGRDRLSGKKVLVWQFAARELASGDWKKISLKLQEKPESDFYTPAPNEQKDVSAVVSAISSSPVPGSVPYKDNVVTLHLDDIRDIETGEEYGQSLVYGWGMQDNVLDPLAKVRTGEQIKIRLIDWDMVQGKYSSYRRSTLTDEMIELELPVWGEILP
ncbi:MAG TPA: hypothetical protein EYH19_01080 [Desulfocapsa sulfexigens]|nr:hypothetical protein [Desulfocapsa sulfexigens]